MEPQLVVRPAPECQRQIAAVAKGLPQMAKLQRQLVIGFTWNKNDNQALAIGNEIVPANPAFRFPATLLPSDSNRQRRA